MQVKNTYPFKLKDKPGRQYQPINLKEMFGFVPEVIMIEKLRGENNRFIVRAVLTKEELEKEKQLKIKQKDEQSKSDNNKDS